MNNHLNSLYSRNSLFWNTQRILEFMIARSLSELEMNIITTPQDHKRMIYSYLDVKSLIRLGNTCQDLYKDKIRILILVEKVVDSYFYIQKNDLGIIKSWTKFPYEDIFYKMYLQRLKKISLKDIQIIKHSTTQKVEEIIIHNQLREIKSHGNIDYTITFFQEYISRLEQREKNEVLGIILQYFHDIIVSPICLVVTTFHSLAKEIHDTIANIFVDDNNVTRRFIIEEIEKNYKSIEKDVRFPIYKLKNFLQCLPLTYGDIVKVIEIGNLLIEMEKKDNLKYFIRDYFDDFLDLEILMMNRNNNFCNIDSYASDIYYQLKMKHNRHHTYGDKLNELFDIVNPSMKETFVKTLDIRMKRDGKQNGYE